MGTLPTPAIAAEAVTTDLGDLDATLLGIEDAYNAKIEAVSGKKKSEGGATAEEEGQYFV